MSFDIFHLEVNSVYEMIDFSVMTRHDKSNVSKLKRLAAGKACGIEIMEARFTTIFIEHQNDAANFNRRCSLNKVDDICVIVRQLQGRKHTDH